MKAMSNKPTPDECWEMWESEKRAEVEYDLTESGEPSLTMSVLADVDLAHVISNEIYPCDTAFSLYPNMDKSVYNDKEMAFSVMENALKKTEEDLSSHFMTHHINHNRLPLPDWKICSDRITELLSRRQGDK